MFQPKFTITPHLLKLIEEITTFREKIQAATIQVAWMPLLQRDARTRNAHGSTAIEGNKLSLEHVQAVDRHQPLPTASVRARREVENHLSALRHIERRSKKKAMTHEDILTLHKLIAAGVMDQGEAGRYRQIDVRVGRHNPPSHQLVSGLMKELLEWWNGRSTAWSPIITSSLIHHRFEEIHPFGDGNGRTGRALALWELYRRGFDTHHIFSVDETYWEHRPRYYRAFEQVALQGGDRTGWLEFTTEILHLTLERVWGRIQNMKSRTGTPTLVLRPKQEELLRLLRDRQALAPHEIWSALSISKQGALDLLKPLIKAGLVKRVGTKKSGRYLLV